MSVTVTIRGPLFDKKISSVVKNAIVEESLNKVQERVERSARAKSSKGRKLVANPKNTVTQTRSDLTLTASSTLLSYRRSGTSWVNKHIGSAGYGKGIIGAMLPNVLRRTAQRIVGDLD